MRIAFVILLWLHLYVNHEQCVGAPSPSAPSETLQEGEGPSTNQSPLEMENGSIRRKRYLSSSLLSSSTASFAVGQQFDSILQRETNLTFSDTEAQISGAVGRTTVVSTADAAIQIQTKKGVTTYKGSVSSVFKSPHKFKRNATWMPTKVRYDEYADRFVMAAVVLPYQNGYQNGVGGTFLNSTLYLAVSKTGSPAGANDWYIQSINTINISIPSLKSITATRAAGLGVGPQTLYVDVLYTYGTQTNDQWGHLLFIFPKSGLYAGGKSTYSIQKPLVALPSSAPAVLRGNVSRIVDLKPASIQGGTVGRGIGTFMVGYGLWNRKALAVGNTSYLYIVTVKNPLGSPTFSSTVLNVGDINLRKWPPFATQLGPELFFIAGRSNPYLTDVTWRNNSLWVVLQGVPLRGPNADQLVVRWFQITTDTANNKFTIADQGEIGAKDLGNGTFTFNPAVAVNRKGVVAFGFSALGPSIHPGAYVVGRAPTDPKGNVSKSFVVKQGVDVIVNTNVHTTFQYNYFSSVAVDPIDDSFWVYNSYAAKRIQTPTGLHSSCGTAWRRFFKSG